VIVVRARHQFTLPVLAALLKSRSLLPGQFVGVDFSFSDCFCTPLRVPARSRDALLVLWLILMDRDVLTTKVESPLMIFTGGLVP